MPNNLGEILGQAVKPKNMFIIDISHHNYNPSIDWNKLALSTPKIEGVYIKSSTGVGSADPRAKESATQAKKHGLPIGYYHYCSLNEEDELKDATEEAEWFIKVLASLPPYNLPLALDIEDPQIIPSLDDGEVQAWIKQFFKTLSAHGLTDYRLYSYTPFLNDHLPPNHDLGNIGLWIAQYRTTLTLPHGWSKAWMWQFTDKGHVNGINGNVDLNKTI